jgi:hypothetical protein
MPFHIESMEREIEFVSSAEALREVRENGQEVQNEVG